jgi:hypothetical protein
LETAKIAIWPVLVGATVAFFVFNRRAQSFFRSTVRKVGAFGIEVSLDEATASEVHVGAGELFDQYRLAIKDYLARQNARRSIQPRLGELVASDFAAFLRASGIPDARLESIRSTIHIPDPLFTGGLCQLVDYVGADGGPTGDGGHGRVWSTRFGIIGVAWRLASCRVVPNVPTNDWRSLAQNWGMTRRQAEAAGRGRQSFVAVPLVDEYSVPLAVFYADAKPENAFGPEADANAGAIARCIGQGAIRVGLVDELVQLRDALRHRGPGITLMADDT